MRLVGFLYKVSVRTEWCRRPTFQPLTFMPSNNYPGFEVPASELSAFSSALDTFVISCKDQSLVTHVTTKPDEFREWLGRNGVRNVQEYPQTQQRIEPVEQFDLIEEMHHFLNSMLVPVKKVFIRKSSEAL